MSANQNRNIGEGGTSTEVLRRLFARQQNAYRSTPAPPLWERKRHLRALEQAILSRRQAFQRAISEDFGGAWKTGGRSAHETDLADLFVTLEGIKDARRHLAKWMAPQARRINLPFLPARAQVRTQPKGVVGIIAPWNYPVQLALAPLVGALAAGNRVMLKPSELTPNTSALLAEMLGEAFDLDTVTVVQGDAQVGAAFSALPFDHLLYTGSTQVGRLVMEAAAKNLTPVTLELGGKSPAIIHEDYDVELAAERIVAGKWLNAGQTCIAPDYLLVQRRRLEDTFAAIARRLRRIYPQLAENPDYTAIINARHRARLHGYLDDARAKGARIEAIHPSNENFDAESYKIPPHLLVDVNDEMAVMQEEIFGPLLPIQVYDSLQDAIDLVNERPRPLALYYFDTDSERADRVLNETTSGGACINDVVLHVAQDDLPFGGVGASGMGAYHGHAGYLTFSHQKSVFRQRRASAAALLAPPYGKTVDRVLRLLLR